MQSPTLEQAVINLIGDIHQTEVRRAIGIEDDVEASEDDIREYIAMQNSMWLLEIISTVIDNEG